MMYQLHAVVVGSLAVAALTGVVVGVALSLALGVVGVGSCAQQPVAL